MSNKKENKLKNFIADHKIEILIAGYGIGSYLLGTAIGLYCFGPSKEVKNFWKMSTRGVYPMVKPADVTTTALEVFGKEAFENGSMFDIQPNDQIVASLLCIAKSET